MSGIRSWEQKLIDILPKSSSDESHDLNLPIAIKY